MQEKDPVLLVVLIDTERLRWLVSGIDMQHRIIPLLASQDNDLADYVDMDFDDQASFLRHRFCNALQRGCDRLWPLRKKACQFVFVIDRPFPNAEPDLTIRVAEHLVEWMVKPPVLFVTAAVLRTESAPADVATIAGSIPTDCHDALIGGLPAVQKAVTEQHLWEPVPLSAL